MVSLEINNSLIDLKGDDSFAITSSIGDIGEINTRNGSFSTSFNIPITSKNLAILGYIDNTNFLSENSTSKRFEANLFQNGTLFQKGFIKIVSFDKKDRSIKVNFFSGNSDWFDLIKDKKLQDLDVSEFVHNWNETEIIASWSHTWENGYIYPFINYEDKSSTTTFTVDQFPVAIFSKMIFNKIFEEIGYKVGGEFWENNTSFEREILPYSGADFSSVPVYLDKGNAKEIYEFNKRGVEESFAILPPNSEVKLNFIDDGLLTSSIIYDYINQKYIVDRSIALDIRAWSTNISGGLISGVNFSVYFKINGVITSNGTINLNQGDEIEWFLRNDQAFPIQPPIEGYIYGCSVTVLQNFTAGSGVVSISASFPDISQGDFVKDVLVRYGIIVDSDISKKTIKLFSLEDVKRNISKAKDWSNKIDTTKGFSIDFQKLVRKYGKINKFKYKTDDNDGYLNGYKSANNIEWGEGSISIDNDFINDERTLYTSVFAPTADTSSFGVSGYRIPFIPNKTSDDLKPRVLYVSSPISVSNLTGGTVASVTIGSTSGITDIPHSWFAFIPYSTAPELLGRSLRFLDQSNDLWTNIHNNDIISLYYRTYNDVLNNPIMYTYYVKLSALDMLTLEFDKPIYIESAQSYFYINRVSQYKANGDSTKVELIKIA